MEENQRITYDLHRLALDPPPPPNNDPICAVAYSNLGLIGLNRDNFEIDTTRTPGPEYLELLLPSMRIAQRLLVHPIAMPKLASNIAQTSQPHSLVEMAIRRVVADMRWLIALDPNNGLPEGIAQHSQMRVSDMSDTYQLRELTIFVNERHMQRFLSVKATSQMGDEAFDRHLLYTAMAIAHALVYAIRPQVAYMLQALPEVNIIYTMPSLSLGSSSARDPDALGWQFETDLLGGGMDAAWKRNAAASALPAASISSEPQGPRFSFGGLQARHRERDGLDTRPIDTVIIRQLATAQGSQIMEIDKTWISELIEAFVHDQMDQIAFPPTVITTPLDLTTFIICGRGTGDNAPNVLPTHGRPLSGRANASTDYGLPTAAVPAAGGGVFGMGALSANPASASGLSFGMPATFGAGTAPGHPSTGLSYGQPTSTNPARPAQTAPSHSSQPSPLEVTAASLRAQLTTVALKELEDRVSALEMAAAAKGNRAEFGAAPAWVTPALAVLIPLVLLLLYRTS